MSEHLEKIEKAHWHLSTGNEFKEAFWLLIGSFDVIEGTWDGVERPTYYCGGLALEHFLKCYLDLQGVTYPESRLGHDLLSLIALESDLKTFFDFDNDDVELIKLLNERYYNHPKYGKDDLRYTKMSGDRTSPHPDTLNELLKKAESKLNDLFSFQTSARDASF
jgi:hypothetical protein